MPEFNNESGFKPSGNVLKYWTLLPQVSSRADNPPVFGKIKGIGIHYLMVSLLIIMEIILATNLNKEGIEFMVFIGLSIADFVIVILPSLVHLSPEFNKAIINANIFVCKTKLQINEKLPANQDNQDNYNTLLRGELNRFESQKTKNKIVEFFISMFIIGLAGYKFVRFYNVLGNDIFVEAIGQFILVVLVVSTLVHLFSTKNVFYHILYFFSFNKQRKEFDNERQHRVTASDTNKPFSLNYLVPYTPMLCGNQRVCQEIFNPDKEQLGENNYKSVILKSGQQDREFRVDKINGNQNVFLIYTGLLLDSEVTELAIHQADSAAITAIFAASKTIQVTQLTGN